MADFDTIPNSATEHSSARLPDGDGANVSARIVTGGGEATSIKLSISASTSVADGQTSLSSSLDAKVNGATFSATSDAAGESASTSVEMIANSQEKLAVAQVIAEAEATGDGESPTASTNAAVGPELEIVDFLQETIETSGDDPTAISRTVLEAMQSGSLASDPLPPSEESAPVEAGNADWLL